MIILLILTIYVIYKLYKILGQENESTFFGQKTESTILENERFNVKN
jgi:hypothetical protein